MPELGRSEHSAARVRRALISAVCLATASAGCGRYWVCEATDATRSALLPATLSATGLFADPATDALGPGVVAYRPQFELWSDGAEKRRWVWLPPGMQIDTTDMDSWLFPVGTKFWKEFRRDGGRVETRLLEKIGPGEGDWAALAYLWNDDQGDALATPFGAIDAGGTPHDVPAAGECVACHGGRKSFVLGFSAIQLSADGAPGDVTLATLAAGGVLSHRPTREVDVPGTETERAALGYLHANCGHCHNPARPEHGGARCFNPENDIYFQLSVNQLASPAETATYRSTVGKVIQPGEPDHSAVIELVSHRGMFRQMPPLATERVDDQAVGLLRSWIAGMGG